MEGIAEWAENLKLTINADKTNYCIFSTNRRHRSSFNANIKSQNSEIKKVDLPTYLGVTLDPKLRFSKHIKQTSSKALEKLNILRNLSGTSWGSRPQTLKSTFCTVIRPVLEYATPIWTSASISVKRKLDSVLHRAAKIIIGAVSSTNNEKAEQECGLPPLESRRKLAQKRSSTLQLDSETRKELNLNHSSLEFLQEPLIPKNPPENTCFELELLQPCSKKEDLVTLRQKGLETIAILSQDNFAIDYTDGSSDRSLSNGGAGIILLLPDASTIARLRTEHLKGMKIDPDKTRSYVQCKHCPDLQVTSNHILECPTVATKLLKMGMVPLRDSLWDFLCTNDAPRIAEAVIKIFYGI
ncbi:reverse transcriptase domain-containing protein [Trichonephila clavipes]|nr:reverse transcriptase domain-containing protein [Trichonephila clavipes]